LFVDRSCAGDEANLVYLPALPLSWLSLPPRVMSPSSYGVSRASSMSPHHLARSLSLSPSLSLSLHLSLTRSLSRSLSLLPRARSKMASHLHHLSYRIISLARSLSRPLSLSCSLLFLSLSFFSLSLTLSLSPPSKRCSVSRGGRIGR
jgi:hypothetical protein